MINSTTHTQTLPNGTSFDMIHVEGGSFMMGSEDEDTYDREKPVHEVTLSSFCIGKYPVTQALFKAVLPHIENPAYFQGDKRPVEKVSWFDALVFCNALNVLCGFEPSYFSDAQFQHIFGKNTEGVFELLNRGEVHLKPNTKGYRLPTEAEWEYAARGGNKSGHFKYAGGDRIEEVAWYWHNNHKETKPFGLKLANELGIHDMSGNVWEWCNDWWDENYYKNSPGQNPKGADYGSNRVLRGGGWSGSPQSCRATDRDNGAPTNRGNGLGFRVVRSPQ